jgi:predicted RNA binding protein YcfA (HicA-like mRNA interferase family)
LPISFEYGNIHTMKVRDVITMIEEDGWYLVRT